MNSHVTRVRPTSRQGSDGFTIIEVLIVLAIAGLILLIVFLAVPALQRNTRNTERKTDAAHLVTAINEFIQNDAGQIPLPIVPPPSTFASVTCTPAYVQYCPFLDGINWAYYSDSQVEYGYNPQGVPPSVAPTETNPEVLYITNYIICNSTNTGAVVSGDYSNIAILYATESGGGAVASQCLEVQ